MKPSVQYYYTSEESRAKCTSEWIKAVAEDLERKKAKAAERKVDKARQVLQNELDKIAGGRAVNVNSASDLGVVFDALGLAYPLTEKTKKPSFTKTWLENHDAPITDLIRNLRKTEKTLGTFIRGHIMEHALDDRIHCEFNQLRSDEYGTVSGRFSSSRPNLQQIPKEDEEIMKMIRGIFVPEPGEEWYQIDFSQIEYRLLVHYAQMKKLQGADKAARAYMDNAATDFHSLVAELIGRDRYFAKRINFGLVYGMGIDKLARSLGLSIADAKPILEDYHAGAPFIRTLNRLCGGTARKRGYIRTILGRRRRFELWEPAGFRSDEECPPLPYNQAIGKYGRNIARAYTYKAMNSLLQGSAADIMKKAMVVSYEAGLFNTEALRLPYLTVHDELDGSKQKGKKGDAVLRELKHTMETCVELSVPLLCEAGKGKNWADTEKFA
jgi:DNA polymerase I-like protein with 3'-5' exonuclease and polymerase domains